MASPTEITVSQLMRLIGLPTSPVVVDVRIESDFDAAPLLVPGSRRHRHTDVATWSSRFAGRSVVVVCQKGLKLSHGTAALLRTQGISAEVLEGGIEAWLACGGPVVDARQLPLGAMDAGSTWVTRARPKIDRIACPWLIRRFVDPHARFLFVPSSEVISVAEKFQATAFDVDGASWSHRGTHCTFDVMLKEFELKSQALDRMATIVRAADTARLDSAPQAAGLLAISLGLSRMYKDDLQQLDAGLMLYDALYRWARDATDETHDWPMPTRGR